MSGAGQVSDVVGTGAAGTAPFAGAGVALGSTAHVTVPATSANLGPGFDAFGLALGYGDELTVTAVPAQGLAHGAEVSVQGEGADCLPTDGTHLAVRTLREAWDAWGVDHGGVDVRVQAVNRIPHGRGQGSSAAVIVAALTAAAALVQPSAPGAAVPGPDEVFAAAAALEGHPDNVAPAVYGGLTLSWQQGEEFRTAGLAPHAELVPIVAIPDVQLATSVARSLLPATVPHTDAVANSAMAALLVHALTQEPQHLLMATRDRLHQDYRAPAMPATAALIGALRERGIAATVSGAGPTVLVLTTRDEAASAEQHVRSLTQEADVTWRVLTPGVDRHGATVKVHRPGH